MLEVQKNELLKIHSSTAKHCEHTAYIKQFFNYNNNTTFKKRKQNE